MKRILFLGILAVSATTLSAQLKVDENGKVIAGERLATMDVNVGAVTPIWKIETRAVTPDSYASLVLSADGKEHTGGRISFGDGDAVYIEEPRGDNDRLHLHAKAGLRFTAGDNTKTNIISYYPTSTVFNGVTFSVPVKATSFVTSSDARLKSNIEGLDNLWHRLSSLTPVSYELNSPETSDGPGIMKANAMDQSTDRRTFGFLAQEVREVYPELVYEDEEGMLALDYQGFIPLLVDAVNTLTATVDRQNEIIEKLQTQVNGSDNATKRMKASITDPSLSPDTNWVAQNKPNPASGKTVIGYNLTPEVSEAYLAIYNLSGLQMLRFDLGERGRGEVTVEEGRLQPGLYIYSLIADGDEVASRRMVIAE